MAGTDVDICPRPLAAEGEPQVGVFHVLGVGKVHWSVHGRTPVTGYFQSYQKIKAASLFTRPS
jgi:hypothetical protein